MMLIIRQLPYDVVSSGSSETVGAKITLLHPQEGGQCSPHTVDGLDKQHQKDTDCICVMGTAQTLSKAVFAARGLHCSLVH